MSRLLLVPALVFCSVSAFACGGGDSPPPSTPSTPTQPSATPAASTGDATPATPLTPTATAADGAWPFGPVQSDGDRSAQLDRLKKDPGPIKSNWTPPGKGDRYGHAEGMINAAPDAVRAKLVDYNHYKDLAGPKFKTVKVVDMQADKTDVYFQLPIMKGLVTINYTTRFPQAAKKVTGGDVIEGTFVKGNIKGMNIAFTVRPGPDDKSSVMVCDLVLQLQVPAPQSAIDEELRDACGDAINALRKQVGAN